MNTIYNLIFIFCLSLCLCEGANLYTDIYRTLNAAPCVLLLDKYGPVGCTSPEDGSTGDLLVIRTQSEFDYFINDHSGDDKAIAMPSSLFNKEATNKLHATKKVKGILLFNDPSPAAGWSPDYPIPNGKWGTQTSVTWNPPGDGLNFEKLPFSVYSLSDEESLNILSLATNDTGFPRNAVRFNTFMHATKDAKTCLRRGQCQPVGGKSVWSSFNTVGTKPIIMAMANMDSTALFHDLAVGADSTVSGIVGLVGSALALQQVNKTGFVKDIIFSLWAGESWGYLGSRKFVNDIQNFKCEDLDTKNNMCNKPFKPDLSFQNIKLEDISAILEFNQIGLSDSKLYMHQQGNTANSITDLLTASQSSGLTLESADAVPPSSFMSFLNASANLPGVVITDHKAEYANKNYHSHLDNAVYNPLFNETICAAATTLARTLYLMATNQNQPDAVSATIEAPCELLTQLTVCLTSNFSCDLISNFLGSPRATSPSYYTGVFGYSISSQFMSSTAALLGNMFSLITAQNLVYNFTSFTPSIPVTGCKKCSSGQDCIQGICVDSETHYHDAISLGIDWDYSKDDWKIVDESQPLWVESNWDSVSVEIYRRANPTTEALFLTAGIIEFIISLVAVFYAKRYFLRNYKIF